MLDVLLSGGITGLLGTVLSGVTDFFKTKQQQEHERELARIELDSQRMELEMRRELATLEGSVRRDVAVIDADARKAEAQAIQEAAAFKALETSYANDSARYGGHWVDSVRGLVRPVITVGGIAMSWIAYFVATAGDLQTAIAYSMLYVTETAALWWFGARAVTRR